MYYRKGSILDSLFTTHKNKYRNNQSIRKHINDAETVALTRQQYHSSAMCKERLEKYCSAATDVKRASGPQHERISGRILATSCVATRNRVSERARV